MATINLLNKESGILFELNYGQYLIKTIGNKTTCIQTGNTNLNIKSDVGVETIKIADRYILTTRSTLLKCGLGSFVVGVACGVGLVWWKDLI